MSTYCQTCICKYAKFETLKCGGVTFSHSSLDNKKSQALLLTHLVCNYKTWTKETLVLPNVMTRNVNGLFSLKKGSFVIIHNVHKETSRTYIGELLNFYKMASGNRYGSVKTAKAVEELKYLSVKVYLPLMVVHFLSFVLWVISITGTHIILCSESFTN